MEIGVIADTHSMMRPEAVEALRGCELILHAGDVGKPAVLEALQEIAPVYAIRGNVDKGDWADDLPESLDIEVGGIRIHMLHDLKQLDFDPAERAVRVVVSGHSHRPELREENGVLYLNPGAAGPRRFKLPIALAELHIDAGRVSVRQIRLEV